MARLKNERDELRWVHRLSISCHVIGHYAVMMTSSWRNDWTHIRRKEQINKQEKEAGVKYVKTLVEKHNSQKVWVQMAISDCLFQNLFLLAQIGQKWPFPIRNPGTIGSKNKNAWGCIWSWQGEQTRLFGDSAQTKIESQRSGNKFAERRTEDQ